MSSSRVWLITGASTGFGYYLACHALDNGEIVVATMRNPASSAELTSKYPSHISNGKLLTLKLDVTNSQEISQVFQTVKEKHGRVDVVFNNAGWAIIGEVEGIPEDKARELFDTNFWGATNVMKEAVKAFRENSPPGGRLLQNSSSSALTCNPGASYYGASKAALESMTEALAQEIDPCWNIKITIIESGPFNTKAIGSNMHLLPSHPSYGSPNIGANQTRIWMSSGELSKVAGDPEKGAKMFYRVASLDNPPFRLPLHPVSLQCAKARIDSIQRGVGGFKEWSDEIF